MSNSIVATALLI